MQGLTSRLYTPSAVHITSARVGAHQAGDGRDGEGLHEVHDDDAAAAAADLLHAVMGAVQGSDGGDGGDRATYDEEHLCGAVGRPVVQQRVAVARIGSSGSSSRSWRSSRRRVVQLS